VLKAAGYVVHTLAHVRTSLLRPHLPGRSHGSKRRNPKPAPERRAAAFASAGIAVVGLEPSCLLTLRDEALVMGLGEGPQSWLSKH